MITVVALTLHGAVTFLSIVITGIVLHSRATLLPTYIPLPSVLPAQNNKTVALFLSNQSSEYKPDLEMPWKTKTFINLVLVDLGFF